MNTWNTLKPSKPVRGIGLPHPTPLGLLLLVLSALTICMGLLLKDATVSLIAFLFMGLFFYAFFAVALRFFLGIRYKKTLSLRLEKQEITQGQSMTVFLDFIMGPPNRENRLPVPGVLVRYELNLSTQDGREIHLSLDYEKLRQNSGYTVLQKPLRGAYFSTEDYSRYFDAFGFFQCRTKITHKEGLRLVVEPCMADQSPPGLQAEGGLEYRTEPTFRRTDDRTDSRPYVPGDDPRRINWKLYGHVGDLFIREGEREPPPHAQLLLLIDSSVDPVLYPGELGRLRIDRLCELALATVVDRHTEGLEISLGYLGSPIVPCAPADAPRLLAFVPAYPITFPLDLPDPPASFHTLVLALPRNAFGSGALDRLLKKTRAVELFVVHENTSDLSAAEASVAFFRAQGVPHVHRFQG